MNKKANIVILNIATVLALIMTVFVFAKLTHQFLSQEVAVKQQMAYDLKMMVDTLVGVPGEVWMKYPYDTSGYSFILDSTAIAVYKTGEPEDTYFIKSFVLPRNHKAYGVVKNESNVCLVKDKKDQKEDYVIITLKKCN